MKMYICKLCTADQMLFQSKFCIIIVQKPITAFARIPPPQQDSALYLDAGFTLRPIQPPLFFPATLLKVSKVIQQWAHCRHTSCNRLWRRMHSSAAGAGQPRGCVVLDCQLRPVVSVVDDGVCQNCRTSPSCKGSRAQFLPQTCPPSVGDLDLYLILWFLWPLAHMSVPQNGISIC